MPAARGGALRPGCNPVDDHPLPPTVAAGPEPSQYEVTRYREGNENRLTPVLRNTIPAGPDPLDSKLGEAVAVCLRSAGTHLLEVRFRQRPRRGADRHGRRYLGVDDGPAPFE